MSNVIKKVFNTEKSEAEQAGQSSLDNTTSYAQNKPSAVDNAKDKVNNLLGGHHDTTNATEATGTTGTSNVAAVSGVNAEAPRSAHVASNTGVSGANHQHSAGLPSSESDAYNRTGLTQTTSTSSGVNVAAGNVDQDVQHLAPVTHHIHHRHEVEELLREREHHIHQHHIQHHVQPVLDAEHLAEQTHARVVPATTVREVHANTDKDAALMRAVAGNPKDTYSQAAVDRSIIDKGETVREIVHHHIHNIVQPIIEKETHEYHRIRTTIPTTHITHEAPIVHESTAHQPIRKEEFIKGGGVLTSTTRSIEEAGLLNLGSNQRTVEGETYTGGLPLSSQQ